jgi:hypothetical protein
MNRKIKVNDFETNSAVKLYAYATAVLDYNVDSIKAQELADIVYRLDIDTNFAMAINELVWYVCSERNKLSNNYKDILTQYKNDYNINLGDKNE